MSRIPAEITPRRGDGPRKVLRRLAARTIRVADSLLPHSNWVDGKFRLLRFWQANRRLPRPSGDPRATFNDLILERMTRDDWTPLERVCVDKEHAKLLAVAMCPSLRLSKTAMVIPVAREQDVGKAFRLLSARAGRAEVAKPTHGSGMVLFLRSFPLPQEIMTFCNKAAQSYHGVSRESQYKGLARKIIVEEDLSRALTAPDDYKFFCSHGEALFCQVDTGRFTEHRRLLVMPGFVPINVRYVYEWPETVPAPPQNFASMVRIAEELSKPFRFVRIDLYSLGNAVYFGEFTFAAEGGAGSLSSESFGIAIMERIRAAMMRQETEI